MKWLGVLLLVRAVLGASHNPDENVGNNDGLFEGDMILTKKQIRRAEAGEDIDSSNKRGSSRFRLWPNGVVPYVIGSSLSGSSTAVSAINAGIADWERKTCLRFIRRTNQPAYINFVFGSGCSSFVGRTGSRQNINLARGCWFPGIVAHEIGHAIGYYHEQSRPDRDNYVRILEENIQDGLESNFRKYPRSTIDSLGTPYDYQSLMHYGNRAFSKNGRPTIEVRPPPGVPASPIGQRQGLSRIDAQQANLLYKAECERRGGGSTTLAPTTTSVPTTSGDPCSNYQILSSADRSQGNTAQNNVRCDQRDLSTPAWYRFMGAAGDRIPNTCVPMLRCGTHAPGWLNGTHPAVQDGQVTRRVCYHWSNNCCRWSNNIKVKNCGGFFVYELQRTPVCSLRYCGNADAGATTLPPTTTPAPTTPVDPCSNYQILSSADRSQGNTAQNNVRCDQRDLSTPAWYRFMGAAGDRIPNTCVPMRRCGTHAPGWLNGGHPTVQDGQVTRRVCYHWSNNCCRWSNNIQVKNCGGFFVYELQRTPACSLRYCGNADAGATTLPPTTTPAPTTPVDPCSNYQILSSADRSQGNTAQNNVRCDQRDLSTPAWYRFMGAAGDRIPNTCVPTLRCGTHAPGWLNDTHPTVQDGQVTRRVCYHWSNNCCRWSNNIQVKNCGGFFVYELQRTPACSLRYCGNADAGATTLPPTTTPAPTTPVDPCSNYRVLSSADRSQGNTAQNNVKCDQRDLSTPAWYRFMGAAGDRIPNTCVPMRRCGTHAPGWLNGAHPTVQDGQVTRRVCYHWSNNCCRWSNNIQVKNCGGFFVYELQRTPVCSLRYCGNADAGATTLPPTTTPAPTTPVDPCSNYRVLSSADRSQGNTAQNNVKCDQRDLSTPAWYRYMGAAGDRIPNTCVPMRRCGTHAPGWLNGGHPTVQDGQVTRRVCYHWSNNCCRWSNNIQVKNCGGFFVYELQRTPVCSLRYCGNADCRDRFSWCRRWPWRNYCRRFSFVRNNCKKTCGRC